MIVDSLDKHKITTVHALHPDFFMRRSEKSLTFLGFVDIIMNI